MSKANKGWLIAAILFIVIGGVLFAGAMSVLKWDFRKLSTEQMTTEEHAVTQPYTNIAVIADTADILFVPSSMGTTVTCYESEKAKHTVTVNDGVLTITVQDRHKWYERIGFGFDTPKITVALPKQEYGALTVDSSTGDLTIPSEFSFASVSVTQSTGDVTSSASVAGSATIQTSTGRICVKNATVGSLDLVVSTGGVTVSNVTCRETLTVAVSTGKTMMEDVQCRHLLSDGDTGDMTLRNVVVGKTLSIERSTGSITFDKCDAAEMVVKTDTGNVKGSLLSDKVFLAQSDTGRVDVPGTTSGGTCEITTDTGHIHITIEQ